MAIDSHLHINSMMVKDVEDEIKRVNDNQNIEAVVNVGVNIATSKEALKIARVNPKFYSTVGVHPLYTDGENLDRIYEIADNDKVVAIGEIGLDSSKDNMAEQKRYLLIQIMIANELHLPVIIHANNTNREVIEVFEKYEKPRYGCVFHCFQPDLEVLDYLIRNGIYISFAGRVTYKNANRSLSVAKKVPNGLFLVETDSPYIAPEPFRGQINHSEYIKHVIDRLASIKEYTPEDISEITTDNTKILFKRMK